MSKTIIKQITYMCPEGIGKNDPIRGIPKGTCRAQGPAGTVCSLHQVLLVRATLDLDLATKTVMGEEDIEPEIIRENIARVERGRLALTLVEENAYRARRQVDIATAITEARKKGYQQP